MKSMTGFGRSRVEIREQAIVDIEIKTVNHRYLEVTSKTPRIFSAGLDLQIKKLASQKLKRGKVDVLLFLKTAATESAAATETFRAELFDQYADIFGKALSRGKLAGGQPLSEKTLQFILSQPGVISISGSISSLDDELDEALQNKVLDTIGEAFDEVIAMRSAEGEALRQSISGQLDILKESVGTVARLNSGASKTVSDRLKLRVRELFSQIEEGARPTDETLEQRIAQELVMISDKVDVTEEISRLESHITQFKQKIIDAGKSDVAIGRELDFLCQEIGRECNTIGSKSQMIEISKVVIELKVLLEQIREQVQNIE